MSEPSRSVADGAGTLARRLVRLADRATLATRRADGWPYASLAEVATDYDGSPLLLLSELAEHTRNLRADPRLSLLFDGTIGLAEPLTGPRVSVLGTARPSEENGHRRRFIQRHPGAIAYAGFGDFHYWYVTVEQAHLVAGFGQIHWLAAAEVLVGEGALAGQAAGIVEHMNQDHGDAIDLYARVLLGQSGEGWQMADIDSDGCDLVRAGETARLAFDVPVLTASEARGRLVELVGRARNR